MTDSDAISASILKWALKNAGDYGQALPGKVASRVLGEHPESKSDLKSLMALIGGECARVNAMNPEQQQAALSAYHFGEKPKEEEGEKKITLPSAVHGRVVTRFPPEPSGHPHIGHAKAAFLNFEAARQYGGHMRLRFDDTNPGKEKAEFVEAITEGLKWLGLSWGEDITYASDYLPRLYEYADELILKQKAYACTCPAEEVKKGRERGEECLCRTKFPEESMHEFRKMMAGKFAEGGAILRFRGQMKAANTVMRDPALFRVITAPHYRQGENYKCWPSYDFAAPILDSLEGVTHAMRSKEYELRDELYRAIPRILEMRVPQLIHFSRLEIAGAPVSKRLIAPMIESGQVSGYDDPRLPTLAGLRRRGIRPEAIRSFVLQFGLSKVESEPGWGKLLSINQKLIDAASPRRFFVADPARVEISGFTPRPLSLKNHPHNPQLGVREMFASSPVYIPGRDARELADGEIFRLKDWCNVRLEGRREEEMPRPDGSSGKAPVLSVSFVSDAGEAERKIQWVGELAKRPAKILVPGDLLKDGKFNPDSLQTVWGWAERSAGDFDAGTTLQFERYAFVVLDAKAEALQFIQISQ